MSNILHIFFVKLTLKYWTKKNIDAWFATDNIYLLCQHIFTVGKKCINNALKSLLSSYGLGVAIYHRLDTEGKFNAHKTLRSRARNKRREASTAQLSLAIARLTNHPAVQFARLTSF